MLGTLRKMDRPVKRLMMAGGGKVGLRLAREMHDSYQIKIIETDRKRCEYLATQLPSSVLVLHGDSTDEDLMADENVRDMDLFLAVTSDDEDNIMACLLAKRMGARRVFALINRKARLLLSDGQTEEAIRASGMEFTFLRDSFYLDFLPALAGEDGVIRGPAGDGLVGAVARSDIAAVAVSVLQDLDSHVGQTYNLTGREALTLSEAASIITEVTGKRTTYVEETLEEAYESRASYNAPAWELDAWVSTYTAIAQGELALITGTVEDLVGQPALTLREFLTAETA